MADGTSQAKSGKPPAAGAGKNNDVGKSNSTCTLADIVKLMLCLKRKIGKWYDFPRTEKTNWMKANMPLLAGWAEDSNDLAAAREAVNKAFATQSPSDVDDARAKAQHFRGCIPTQSAVLHYLKECLEQFPDLKNKYEVRPVATRQGTPFTHYANALFPIGGSPQDGYIVDPWIEQSADINDMLWNPDSWSIVQAGAPIEAMQPDPNLPNTPWEKLDPSGSPDLPK